MVFYNTILHYKTSRTFIGHRLTKVVRECLFVCLIDFEKAFDRVDREIIWLRLEERGIHGKLLEAIKAMYSQVTQKVRINGKLGEAFQTFYGVKQGDPLSTDLFGIMIEI